MVPDFANVCVTGQLMQAIWTFSSGPVAKNLRVHGK